MDLTLAQKIAIWALPLLFAITLHEVAHGWVASFFGDKTAKLSGRLSLNPIKHIDPIGTIIIPLLLLITGGFIFGWAKPVPVNSRNVRNPRLDMPIISLAGPVSNFVMAILWAAIAKWGSLMQVSSPMFAGPMMGMGAAGIIINLMLGILNCLPIPPLDGWHALSYAVTGRLSYHLARIERYGFFILVILLVTGILSYIITPPFMFLLNVVCQWFGLSPYDVLSYFQSSTAQ